ncbi:MAG: hypothetical protein ACFFD4_26885 [Candidatus Odinarchaeota archaeon]
MDQRIANYILEYLFQRVEPVDWKFDYTNRCLNLSDHQVILPDIERTGTPIKKEILGHSVTFYRAIDQVSIESKNDAIHLTFDIIGEVYDHLTLARENDPAFDPSDDEVFLPVLDMKIHFFFGLLKTRIKGIRYRKYGEKSFVLCLSHDIDRTGDSWKYRVITHLFQSIKQKRPRLLFEGLFTSNKEANFEHILEREQEYNAKATWFVLTRYGLKKNADYHLKDKVFQKGFNLIREAGHEIGLHVPFVDLNVESIKREKEKITGVSVKGARMHHLRGKYEEVVAILSGAGLIYDSTFGFNWNMAYRFGTSVPFHPLLGPEIYDGFYEVPMNIMDFQIMDLNDFKNNIQRIFSLLEQLHGVYVANWHNNRFNQVKYGNIWRESFDILLEEAKKHGALITTIGDVVEIIKQRNIS